MNDGEKVHHLDVKQAARSDLPPFRTVRSLDCPHNRILIDEQLAEVECKDCKAKLNPVAVLARLANRDDRLVQERVALKQQVEKLKDRLRFKCGACGHVNNISAPLHSRVRTLR